MKNCNKNSGIGYTFQVDVRYPKHLHDSHNDLPFSTKRMTIGKFQEIVCNLYNKEKYFVHIRTLKQPLHHRLILKGVERVIKTWLNHIVI